MFTSIITANSLTLGVAMMCTAVSIVLGIIIAGAYMICEKNYSKNYIITLALLPALVEVVIMLVNGNLGTGVAIMGAFSLVRFRSMPGNAKEIAGVFFSMVVGLATGMGYLTFAGLITVLLGVILVVLSRTGFGKKKAGDMDLRITIPEHLDYVGVFDEVFSKYTKNSELVRVKTTNMGSMYELFYKVNLQDIRNQKAFIDDLRIRNGNLNISLAKSESRSDEL
ncbi:MAG: DUF4956 domain-containing protein [Lachnospiraceae bacterium]|nr:DUF4956 domain-containing protein [Lachnospiraceae bacterium]